jgi:hypothetical protein
MKAAAVQIAEKACVHRSSRVAMRLHSLSFAHVFSVWIIVTVLVLLFVNLHLTGNSLGPTPSSGVTEHGVQRHDHDAPASAGSHSPRMSLPRRSRIGQRI